MIRSLRGYFIALFIVILGVIAAATIYSGKYPSQSHWITIGVLPAFLIEAVFFVATGFPAARSLLARMKPPALLSAVLWLSAIVPFLIVSLTAHTFDSHAFYLVCALFAILAFWWVLFPHRAAYLAGFLIIAALPVALRVFARLYISPSAHLQIDLLGHLSWIHIGIFGLLLQGRFELGPATFWPHAREWLLGAKWYLISMVPVFAIAVWLHFVSFAPRRGSVAALVLLAIGYFFGTLWVVAWSEDLFRSVLTVMFLPWGRPAAIIGSAILFGCAHLWFRDFPNWPFAAAAAIGHAFFTAAYLQAGSVRASMVAHALTVTTWRMFFR